MLVTQQPFLVCTSLLNFSYQHGSEQPHMWIVQCVLHLYCLSDAIQCAEGSSHQPQWVVMTRPRRLRRLQATHMHPPARQGAPPVTTKTMKVRAISTSCLAAFGTHVVFTATCRSCMQQASFSPASMLNVCPFRISARQRTRSCIVDCCTHSSSYAVIA